MMITCRVTAENERWQSIRIESEIIQPGAESNSAPGLTAATIITDDFMKRDMKILIGLTALVSGSYFALSLIIRKKKTNDIDTGYGATTY